MDSFYVLFYVQTDTPDINISRNVRKEFGFRVSLVHWRLYSYVQHLAGILAPIFPKPRDTRVRMFFTVLQSNIFERYKIQVEVTSVKHLFKFYMELDGISSTSFQVFDYAELKGKRQRNLKPFYFAWSNLRLPPRLHVTRARPYQGGSWECWGPPWISTFETWNIYWEYIYVIFLHTDIHTNSLVLIRPAQPTQKDR